MMGSLRNLLTPAFLVLLVHAIVLASDVAVTARVDRNHISQDESLEYSVEVSGDISTLPNVALPKLT